MIMHNSTKQALDLLIERVERGEWAKNSFLPPGRKLCVELGVGRGSLLAVLRELAARGYVRFERNRGVRVIASTTHALRRVMVIESAEFAGSYPAEHLAILNAISTAANKNHVDIILTFATADLTAEKLIERYGRGEYQGVIIAEAAEMVDTALLLRHGIPAVVANLEKDTTAFPAVRVDFREVGRIAGREFLANGHIRVGMLSGPADSFIFKEMLAGLKGALAEEDIWLPHENVVFWEATGSEEPLTHLLLRADRPTALFVARDWRAAKVYKVCEKIGLRIPDDLSVVSYDNLSWSEAPEAGLTTVSEPTSDIGEMSVKMVNDWVCSGKKPPDGLVHGRLVQRGSVKKMTGADLDSTD